MTERLQPTGQMKIHFSEEHSICINQCQHLLYYLTPHPGPDQDLPSQDLFLKVKLLERSKLGLTGRPRPITIILKPQHF